MNIEIIWMPVHLKELKYLLFIKKISSLTFVYNTLSLYKRNNCHFVCKCTFNNVSHLISFSFPTLFHGI